jgi:hypothetical protein
MYFLKHHKPLQLPSKLYSICINYAFVQVVLTDYVSLLLLLLSSSSSYFSSSSSSSSSSFGYMVLLSLTFASLTIMPILRIGWVSEQVIFSGERLLAFTQPLNLG